ncbi:MAG: dihydrolipoyl dehydrogenase [Thaumarchaeota archaeon]|nr:dihydrolipoyl dehydrogenase [Nitrososphaerota archaeon]
MLRMNGIGKGDLLRFIAKHLGSLNMYDVVVIGAGPGGYACAIRAAQLGGNICLIEKNGLGGTCTQRGCIPTKFLHSLGDIVRRVTAAKKNGINAQIELNYKTLKLRTEATVAKLASGIKLLIQSNGIDLMEGEAHIISHNKVVVNERIVETKHIVISTGSHPICLQGYEFGKNILSTDAVLELEELPKSIIIVGGGYSGCEFASILNILGCSVTLVEAEDRLIPLQIEDIGNTIEKYMRLDGINIITNSRIEKIVNNVVHVNGEELQTDKVLFCVGRRQNISEDELNNIGVKFNQQGIIVDEEMRTSVHNIFAIGDITGIYELAHVASKQGEIAAQNIMGIESVMDYRSVPTCIFTYPEVAFVGELKGKSGEFPLAASAKANCLGDTRGFIKVFEKNGILTGTFIIAPHAGEMISEAALAIRMQLRLEDVFDTIHTHPTLPESFVDAIRDINSEAIHLPSKGSRK